MFTTFQEYQSQYEPACFYLIEEQWGNLKAGCRQLIFKIDPYIQGTELVVKTTQFALLIFSCFSSLSNFLETPQHLCYDVRRFTDALKGLKSVDSLLHFTFSWRTTVLTLSGLSLLILSIISLVDRFKLFDISDIQSYLGAIPMMGTLPYGGLLNISLVGLLSMIILNSWDKKKKLDEEIMHIENEKIRCWSLPFGLQDVKNKKSKYLEKINHLSEEIARDENLLIEGEARQNLDQGNQRWNQMRACDLAVAKLRECVQTKQDILSKYKRKMIQWQFLEINWEQISSEDIYQFSQAKKKKWEKKLHKLEQEKQAILFSSISHTTVIASQMFSIGAVLTNHHSLAAVKATKIGLDVVATVCSMRSFLIKKSVRRMTFASVTFQSNREIEALNLATGIK